MTSPALSPWQARQAAMLYRYTSLEYLQEFHLVLCQIVEGSVDPMLAAPAKHGFHSILQTAQWGKHDAYKNSQPCPFNVFDRLRDGLARDIMERKKGVYRPTRRDEELRDIEQFWWQPLTPEEEHQYKLQVALINFLAEPIDSLFRAPALGWDHHHFAKHFPSFRIDSPQIPRFRIRHDISVESARQASRTGVYVPADDPHGSLQFAVANNESHGLKDAITFSSMGLDALSAIGRNDLWFNDRKMLDFAANRNLLNKYRSWADRDGSFHPSVGRLAIAESAFEARPTQWHFVEVIPDEFEDVDFAQLAILTTSVLHAGTAHALPQGIHKWETSGGKLILVHGIYQDEIHYRRNYSFYFQQDSSPGDWLQVPIMEKKGVPSIGWDSASHGEVTVADATVVQRAGKMFFITASKRIGKGTPYDPGDVTVTWHELYDAGDNDHDGTAQKFKPVFSRVVRAVANGVDEILEKESKLPYIEKQSIEDLKFDKIKPVGKVVSVLRVAGPKDENVLVLSEKSSKSANGRIERIDLNASYYAKAGGQWKSEWAINDLVDCPGLDSKASFFPDATTVTDVDNDGKPEITVAYQLFCGGGIDPSTVKVILCQGDTKFAIRGESLVRVPGQVPIGGNRAPDPSLLQPKNAAYLKQLQTVWNTVYVEKR